MLDPAYIREHSDDVRDSIARRGIEVDLERFLELDAERRRLIPEVDALRAELKPSGQPTADELISLQGRKVELQGLEKRLGLIEAEYSGLHRRIPNVIHPETPTGADDSANEELRRVGEPPTFGFEPRDHLSLGESLDLLDFERGAKVAGSRFYFLKNEAVLIEMALMRYGLETLVREGFVPLQTPDLARNEVLDGVGFAPRGDESNTYTVEGTDLSLTPTAEVGLAGYHADEILDLSKPIKYVGLSHCFRREAGTYGAESKGLYRVHQFTKLEMFVYCRPEQSEALHVELLGLEEQLWNGLGVPYRVVDTVSGDLGAPAYRKYDIEAWMPSRSAYGEVTSTSNTTDYQTRRLGIRYRHDAGTGYAHTLNGTAIAAPRALIAILENFQRADGSVAIPEALHPYLGFTEIRR